MELRGRQRAPEVQMLSPLGSGKRKAQRRRSGMPRLMPMGVRCRLAEPRHEELHFNPSSPHESFGLASAGSRSALSINYQSVNSS